jgi:predicted RNA-binding Zn-ribbon protein involved in translation (DUF1610 family)
MRKEHAKVCAVTDSQLVDKLTSDAEFSCAKCGAKAHDRESVCAPVPIGSGH